MNSHVRDTISFESILGTAQFNPNKHDFRFGSGKFPWLIILTSIYIWSSSSLPLSQNISFLRWPCIVVLAMRAIGASIFSRGRVRTPFPLLLLIMFCGFALISSPYSVLPKVSAIRAVAFVILIFATVFSNTWIESQSLHSWIYGIAIINVVACIYFWIQLLTGFGNPYVGTAFAGFTLNPNDLGSYLALSIGPAIILVRDQALSRYQTQKFIGYCTIGSDAIFIVLTHSRTSMAAGIVAMLLFVLTMQKGVRLRMVLVTLIIVVAMYAVAGNRLNAGIQHLIMKGGSSSILTSRVQSLDLTWLQFLHNPIAGNGFGYLAPKPGAPVSQSISDIFHVTGIEQSNSFLGIASDLGIVGLLLMISSLLGVVFYLKPNDWIVRRKTILAEDVGLYSIFFVGLVHMNGEAWLVAPGAYQAFIFWTAVGFIMRSTTAGQDSTKQMRTKNKL